MPDVVLPALLRTLVADPGRPRLTWYGPAGERVELSGHVLDNWVTKTTNLLVEEYQAGPGTRVLLDLPPHWRTVVWAMAAWRTGAHVVLDPTVRPDVTVTTRPGERTGEVVAIALPALARGVDGPLPPGVLDATAAVLSYGDVLTWVPEPDPTSPAVTANGREVSHADLAAWCEPGPPGARLLVEAGEDPAPVLARTLGAYLTDGSVVLCAAEVAAELAADPARRERLVAQERITA